MKGQGDFQWTQARVNRTYWILVTALLGVCVGIALAQAETEGYARPELLAETEWLAQRLNDPQLWIVDLRSEEAYRQGHIPGAVSLSPKRLKDPDSEVYVIAPDPFVELMGDLGIGHDTTVVGYHDQGGLFAAGLWWVLDYYGHAQTMVLNGGWNTWVQEKRPVTTEVPHPQPVAFAVKPDPMKLSLVDDVLTDLKRPSVVIVDARSPAEYSGFDVRAKRGGHIRGAVNLEWVRNLTNDALKTFRPAAELRKMYAAAGMTRDKAIITYCQTGVRAAHALFTLRLLGYDRVRNYDGSWQEWGNGAIGPIAPLPGSEELDLLPDGHVYERKERS
jgi:thiosulfate/3-mercaptopyruvate sulfurtransferase